MRAICCLPREKPQGSRSPLGVFSAFRQVLQPSGPLLRKRSVMRTEIRTCPSDPHRRKPMRWSRNSEHPEVLSSEPNPSPGRLPGLKPAAPGFPWTPLPGLPVCGYLGSPLGSDLNIAPIAPLFKPDRWLLFADHQSFSRPAITVPDARSRYPVSCLLSLVSDKKK